MMRTAKVKYQIGQYNGTVSVSCDPNDDNEQVISMARSILRRQSGGSLPPGSENFKVLS